MWEKLEAVISANNSTSKDIAHVLAKWGTPSTSIAVLDNGDIDSRCYSTVGDDTETVFQACSISKPLAAMAAMKLVAQGQLSLDESITTFLPTSTVAAMSTPETADLLEHVTIKHLLSHTSGLTVHGFPGYVEHVAAPETIVSGEAPANTTQVRLSAFPGQRFAYSGGGITVLQIILETITKNPFAQLMQDLVLNPLNMTRSFYSTPSAEDNHALAHWTGHQATEFPFRIHPEQAAAGLWTTPTDLLKAVRAMQQSLTATATDTKTFMDQALARKMLDEVHSGAALGWFAPKNGTGFQHSGGNIGFKCHVFGYAALGAEGVSVPEQSGVCVMTNSEQGYDVVKKVTHAVAYLKGWPRLTSSYGSEKAEVPFCVVGDVESDEWASWQGRWGEDWEILEADGAPAVRFQSLPLVRLRPAAWPQQVTADETCIDLVLDGLSLMVRLREIDGDKVVEILDGTMGKISELQKQ